MKTQLSIIRTLFRFKTYTIINIVRLASERSGNDNNSALYPSGINGRPFLQRFRSPVFTHRSVK